MTDICCSQINKTIRIEEVIGRYIRLHRGSNSGKTLQAHCPFHFDKHLSLKVKVTDQLYECASCHEKGNAVTFIQSMEGCTYTEAIDLLAEWFHLEREEVMEEEETYPNLSVGPTDPDVFPNNENKLLYIHQHVLSTMIIHSLGPYHSSNPDMQESYKWFDVGVAPDHLPDTYSDLSKCLVFPIRDGAGIITALVGFRPGKRLNAYTSIPSQSDCYSLFGLYQAIDSILRSGFVYLVNHYEDVIAMHVAGFSNTVAYCGDQLGITQIQMLAKHTHTIVLLHDNKKADQINAFKAMSRIEHARIICNQVCTGVSYTLPILLDRVGKAGLRQYIGRITRIGWLKNYKKELSRRLSVLGEELEATQDVQPRIELHTRQINIRKKLQKTTSLIENYSIDPFS